MGKTSAATTLAPQPMASAAEIAERFIACLTASDHQTWPYDHWLLDQPLPDSVVDGIADLPVPPPTGLTFYGKREINNASRVYFSKENQAKHPVCREMAAAFKSPALIAAIAQATGRDVTPGQLRIEYCQDTDGFWLEPHLDIGVKLFTMLVYLSDDPNLRDAGTDIYDDSPEHKRVGTAPYERNKGLIFIPGHNTWHGFTKRPIKGVRKSIIINYVTKDWRAVEELA